MPSTIIPCLRYRRAVEAIDFLCKAFDFQAHAVFRHAHDDSVVEHAQLTYGGGMVMLGSVREDTPFARHMVQPDEVMGRETQCACVTVTGDLRAHYERAKAAGALIVEEYAEKHQGGAGYAARDPEGHLWYFGTYDPWADA
ncbi:VOC family protein [Luteibacter sp. PPL552]|jgi:uncharacterized glyoxalase superfamily protein PhnB